MMFFQGRWIRWVSALAAIPAVASEFDAANGISSDGTLPNANGGTEQMRRGLEARLPRIFLDAFSLSSSRVRELPPGKKHVLWLHDLPQDVESQRLADPSFREQFEVIVFVSEWQKRRYEEHFGIDFGPQAGVLRNAIRSFRHEDIQKPRDGPLRLIYHTTPHRGLQILIPSFLELYKKHGDKIHLDVYSSFKIYGWEWRDEPFRALFDQCREHPGCTYHGSVPNEEVREALRASHIFAYPNTWKETSCIAAIEAMSAGVEVVTSRHAALPETLGNGRFGVTYPYEEDFREHAFAFLRAMDDAIETFWEPESEMRRRQMSLFAANAYDWGFAGWTAGGRMEGWIQVLSARMPEFEKVPRRSDFASDERFSEALFVAAKRREMRGEVSAARGIYLEALEANPASSLVSLTLGLLETNMPGNEKSGIDRLEAVVAPGSDLVPPPEQDSIVAYGTAIRASYWYSQRHYEEEARSALDRAFASDYPHDDCWALYRATYLAHVPMTQEEADRNIALYHQRLDELIARADRLICDNTKNLKSPFSIAYYDLDFRDEIKKWTRLYMLAYRSSLVLSAPSLQHRESLGQRSLESITKERPLRIGFVSSFFTPDSSIWGSFGKTVNALQVNPSFDVDMIYYPRSEISEAHKALSLNPETNLYLSEFSISPHDANRRRARKEIASRRYDVLVYLDLWMTMETNELAVAKLAPIQMVTHGHPLTSGIPPRVMDYFISWSAAELPDPEAARAFYTEELILLPGDQPWEYYEPRTSNGTSNLANGADFSHYTRGSLADAVLAHDKEAAALLRDPGSVLYFCAQATFKLHIAFDKILSEIQRLDPKAVLVLIELQGDELSHIHTKMKKRLEENSGVDMNRVVFIPRMKHHHLMGMYQNADAVLDSLYFGGDTTSREAFETGAPIITLPHKTIGQRWTQAYYKMMGIEDFIAQDINHYAHLAVEVANRSPEAKTQVRERIKRLAHETLFRRTDGAQYWADMFLDVATRPRRWRWSDEKLQEPEEISRDEL